MTDESAQVTPFLWMDGCAREAAEFYVSVFRDSRIVDDTALPEGPGAGSHVVSLVIKGQRFTAFDGIPAYEFTPAISFLVNCDSQEEIDHYWDRLSEGGSPIQCGWIQDKFGVHWQIVPADLAQMMQDGPRANAVLNELITMVKIDAGRLRRAYNGD